MGKRNLSGTDGFERSAFDDAEWNPPFLSSDDNDENDEYYDDTREQTRPTSFTISASQHQPYTDPETEALPQEQSPAPQFVAGDDSASSTLRSEPSPQPSPRSPEQPVTPHRNNYPDNGDYFDNYNDGRNPDNPSKNQTAWIIAVAICFCVLTVTIGAIMFNSMGNSRKGQPQSEQSQVPAVVTQTVTAPPSTVTPPPETKTVTETPSATTVTQTETQTETASPEQPSEPSSQPTATVTETTTETATAQPTP